VFAALDRLMLEPGPQVLFIGDSPADIFAASNAGCTSVAATWGTLDEDLLMDTSPQVVVRAPVEVVELVRGLGDASG
jgi:phosphoglycolate phosphatase-like HAD superfamily hydrolase